MRSDSEPALSQPETEPAQKVKQFFWMEADKEAVEVAAAAALNDAIKTSAETLRGEACAHLPPHWRALGDHLRGLDHSFTAEQRGNARRLCAQARHFAEAANAVASHAAASLARARAQRLRPPKALEEELTGICDAASALRVATVWANHPPLSAGQYEWRSHADASAAAAATSVTAGAPGPPVYSLVEVTAAGIRAAADAVRTLLSRICSLASHAAAADSTLLLALARAPPLAWQVQVDDPGLPDAYAALEAAVAAAKDDFAAARDALGAGKHGAWARFASHWRCCTLERHALVLLEAAEHLVVGVGGTVAAAPPMPVMGSDAPAVAGDSATAPPPRPLPPPAQAAVVGTCLGARMFAELVVSAMWHMPLRRLGCQGLFFSAQRLLVLTQWAGHPPTHVSRHQAKAAAAVEAAAEWAATAAQQPGAPAGGTVHGSLAGSGSSIFSDRGCLRVDAAYLRCVGAALTATADKALAVLAFFLEQPRRRLLDLAPAAHDPGGDWRAALLLGLCLKDAVPQVRGQEHQQGQQQPTAAVRAKEPAAPAQSAASAPPGSAPPSRGGRATAFSGRRAAADDAALWADDDVEDEGCNDNDDGSGGGTIAPPRVPAYRGIISFAYRHALLDAEAMLRVAYEGALRQVASAAAAVPTGGVDDATLHQQLLHDAAVARKEHAYCVRTLNERQPPGARELLPAHEDHPIPGAPKSCSKEAAMRRLGEALLKPLRRPPTATELRDAAAAAAVPAAVAVAAGGAASS